VGLVAVLLLVLLLVDKGGMVGAVLLLMELERTTKGLEVAFFFFILSISPPPGEALECTGVDARDVGFSFVVCVLSLVVVLSDVVVVC